jgi:hypothetical protein
METAATSKLSAPDGTELDRSDAAFCKSKTFRESPGSLARQGFGTCGAGSTKGITLSSSQVYVGISSVVLVIATWMIFFAGRKGKENRLTPLAGLTFGLLLASLFFGHAKAIGYMALGVGAILAVVATIRRSRSGGK